MVLVLIGVAVAVADMIVGLVRLTWSLLRSGREDVPDGEIFSGELRGHHWAVTFCHTFVPAVADRLCTDAFWRAVALTDACLSEDPAFAQGISAFKSTALPIPVSGTSSDPCRPSNRSRARIGSSSAPKGNSSTPIMTLSGR